MIADCGLRIADLLKVVLRTLYLVLSIITKYTRLPKEYGGQEERSTDYL